MGRGDTRPGPSTRAPSRPGFSLLRRPSTRDSITAMPIRKNTFVDLTIDTMAHGGPGVGRVDGFVLFVRGAAPGDRVRAKVIRKKKDYAEARIAEILEPSPDRICPPCPYAGFCGGCQWQHIDYNRQLSEKKGLIEQAVARIGGLQGVFIHDPLPSERRFGYRNKMEFSFSDRRWLLPGEMDQEGIDRDFALGLHVPGTFHKVLDIEACLLQHDTGNRILRRVKTLIKQSGLPVYGLKSHQGHWRFLTLRYSRAGDEWMVNVVTSDENRAVLESLSGDLMGAFPSIRTVVNNITARKAGVATGEREIHLAGPGFIEDRIGPYAFRISANSFFQTNTEGADALYRTVLRFAALTGTEAVLDLYSGTGTIPIYLAHRAGSVVGMELVESAVSDAQKNCEANGVSSCRFVLGDIKENLKTMTFKPDVLIIDPPRAGMHKDVLGRVLEMKTPRIVYVSCNPGTLARDLARLAEDYEVTEIQPVDLFPHTYHVEAVAGLRRRN